MSRAALALGRGEPASCPPSAVREIDDVAKAVNATAGLLAEHSRQRDRAEAALREGEAVLFRAQEIANLGNWVRDFEAETLSWSPNMYRIHGVSPETFTPTYENNKAMIHQEDRPRLKAWEEELRQGKSPAGVDVRLLRADGETRSIRVEGQAFFDSRGKLLRVVGTRQDVTDQHLREDALRQTQTLLGAIVSSSADAMISQTLEGVVTTWNKAAERIFGYAAEEMIGQSIFRLAAPGALADMKEEVLDKIRRDQRIENYETQRRRKDGVVIDVSLTVSPIHDATGRVIGASKILRDITAAKRAGKARRDSEMRYRTTFDIAPIGIIHVSPQNRLLMANEYFCRLLGYDGEEIQGRSMLDLTAPDDREETDARFRKIVEGDAATGSFVKKYIAKDGRLIWCQVTFAAQRDEAGIFTHAITIVADISAAKAAEERQRALAAQLQQAQKMEAVGQLTGGIAHDFNNLLTVILANAQALAEELDGEHQELAGLCVLAAQRGADLTSRLLAFSRRQVLTPEPLEINRLVGRVIDLLHRTLGEDIEIVSHLGGDLRTAIADGAQLEAALLNLANNARDAMPGGGRIIIETANVTLDDAYAAVNPEVIPGPFVLVALSDSGTGMPAEVIAKAFDPFFTTKEVGKGTGLGLSMVYGFVRQSGGHIKIYSEVGIGTTIKLYLPALDGARGTRPAPDAATAAALAAKPGRQGRETILRVEDDALVRRSVSRQVRGLGYQVIEAQNGQEALERLQEGGPVGLLFTDFVMPGGLNGSELATAARKLRPGLRVLFTSGYTGLTVAGLSGLGPRDRLLSKPYLEAELAQHLRVALDEETT